MKAKNGFEPQAILNKNDLQEFYNVDIDTGVDLHLKIFNMIEATVSLLEVVKDGFAKLKFVHPNKEFKKFRIKIYIKYSKKHSTFVLFTMFAILNETDLALTTFSYNDLNEAKPLMCDQDKNVFLMTKTAHENYGIEYHQKQFERFGVTNTKVRMTNAIFPKKIQHTIVTDIKSYLKNDNDEKSFYMHSLVIRPSV